MIVLIQNGDDNGNENDDDDDEDDDNDGNNNVYNNYVNVNIYTLLQPFKKIMTQINIIIIIRNGSISYYNDKNGSNISIHNNNINKIHNINNSNARINIKSKMIQI